MWISRIRRAKPQRFFTLTCDPSRFQDPREAFNAMKAVLPSLFKLIRQELGHFEYVAAFEFTKKGWPHVHILQKGCFVPQRWLSATWANLGIGSIVFVKAVPNSKTAAHYVVKYLTKNSADTVEQAPGKRIITTSRGFLDDVELPPPDDPDEDYVWYYTPISYAQVVYTLSVAWGWTPDTQEERTLFDARPPPASAFQSRDEHDEQVMIARLLA